MHIVMPMAESEKSFANVSTVESVPSIWRREPFRLFFVLGVVLAWLGIGHWIAYDVGLLSTYSCQAHGLTQMQSFMMAFAMGFLLTALPRRTQTAPASVVELVLVGLALITTAAATLRESWIIGETAYALLFLFLLQFALRRFLGRAAGRRPPAAFVLIPFAVLHGLGGAALVALSTRPTAAPFASGLGRLMIEQGVFLCLALGIGSLVLPLMAGTPPPPDLGSSPRETRKALAYAACGATIFATLLVEQSGWGRLGPLLRAAVVCGGFWLGADARHRPGKPGLHRHLVWVSIWLMPLGLLVSALFPDYRVPALHIVFIGGFSLMAFGVATHVTLSHLEGLGELALGNPRPVKFLAAAFGCALAARLAADMSDTYFDHLAWAAGLWICGSAVWLVFLGPKLLRPRQ